MMQSVDTPLPPLAVAGKAQDQSGVLRRTLRTREGQAGVFLLCVTAVLVIAGPWIAHSSPYAVVAQPLAGPSAAHPLGTDELGRDVLSRFLSGGRGVVLIPIAGVCVAFVSGGLLGLIAGFGGGWPDLIFARVVDVLLAVPTLLIALVLIGAAGGGAFVIILTIGLVYAPGVARITRGASQASARTEFVEIARLRGEGPVSIALRELLPNVAGTLAVEFTIRCTQAVLLVATLDFLGVGAQPPSPNWGLMISQGQEIMALQPYVVIGPAIGLACLAIGLNLFASALSRSTGVRPR